MKFIPTQIHGVLDYIGGLVLIACPWLFDFADGGAAMWTPVVIGAGMIGAAMFTDYELGLVRAIPMRVHLAMDAAFGVLLAISPWLFQFDHLVWIPHVVFGVAEILGAAMTETVAGSKSLFGPKTMAR